VSPRLARRAFVAALGLCQVIHDAYRWRLNLYLAV